MGVSAVKVVGGGRGAQDGVYFFKQKTAYEIRLSLVGSVMCIRARGYSIDGQIDKLTSFCKIKDCIV